MFEDTWSSRPYIRRFGWERHMLHTLGPYENAFILSVMWEPLAVAIYRQVKFTLIAALGTEMTALDVFGEI